MLCEPRLSVVIGVRGDIQRKDFHNQADRRQLKCRKHLMTVLTYFASLPAKSQIPIPKVPGSNQILTSSANGASHQ